MCARDLYLKSQLIDFIRRYSVLSSKLQSLGLIKVTLLNQVQSIPLEQSLNCFSLRDISID